MCFPRSPLEHEPALVGSRKPPLLRVHLDGRAHPRPATVSRPVVLTLMGCSPLWRGFDAQGVYTEAELVVVKSNMQSIKSLSDDEVGPEFPCDERAEVVKQKTTIDLIVELLLRSRASTKLAPAQRALY